MKNIRPTTAKDLGELERIYDCARKFMKANGNPNQWRDDKPNLDEVVSDIVEIYENSKVSNVNLEYLTDFQQVKSCLSAKVLNFERNKNMIDNNNLVYKLLTDDLVIIPTIEIDFNGSGVISISKSLFEKWGITEKALFKAVNDSLENKPYSLKSIFEWLGAPESSFSPIYVLTNVEAVHGASELLNNKAMTELCDKLHSTSIIVLPSSIHEIIALPNDESADIDELITIVRSVNATTVSSTDFLSNSVYIYDKESGKIEIYNN